MVAIEQRQSFIKLLYRTSNKLPRNFKCERLLQKCRRMQIGKRHFEIATKWIPSALTYGGAAGLTLIYFTDWKVVARYIPFYGSKFDN